MARVSHYERPHVFVGNVVACRQVALALGIGGRPFRATQPEHVAGSFGGFSVYLCAGYERQPAWQQIRAVLGSYKRCSSEREFVLRDKNLRCRVVVPIAVEGS